jgi:hypothetical protein
MLEQLTRKTLNGLTIVPLPIVMSTINDLNMNHSSLDVNELARYPQELTCSSLASPLEPIMKNVGNIRVCLHRLATI